MAETKPRSEQLRFISSKTGEHTIDNYLEACERPGRTLPAMLDELFDETGEISPTLFQFRIQDVTGFGEYEFQYRLGAFIDPEDGWIAISEDLFGDIVTLCQTAEQSAAQDALNASTSADTAFSYAQDSETSAQSSETFAISSEASATAAQMALESMAFPDVLNISADDSPYTVTASNLRNYISVNTSAGNVIINVTPSLTEPFGFRVKKETGNTNTVTINLGGTETFKDGTTSKVLSFVGGLDMTLDTSTSPDTWNVAEFGAVAGEKKKQLFTRALAQFTTNQTTLTLTNTPIAPSSNSLIMSIDGVDQHSDAFSYNPSTGVVTLDPIDASTQSIEFKWDSGSLSIGTPADTSVSWAKFASGVVGALADIVAGVTTKFATCKAVLDYVTQPNNILQTVSATTSTKLTFTETFPWDATIPQISEGREYLTVTITPRKSNSKLIIESLIPLADNTGTNAIASALFRVGVNDALNAGAVTHAGSTYALQLANKAEVIAGTASPITFSLRIGVQGGTGYIGRLQNLVDYFGSSASSFLKVTEVAQ